MSDLDDDFSLEALLERARDSWLDEVHTALVGKVESYDAAKQVGDVAPVVKRAVPRADGTYANETLPTIRAVPFVWPRAGEWFLHFPISAGDFVLLVALERDIAQWRSTGQAAEVIDRRTHHLAHCVALPGLFPKSRAISDAPGNAFVVGRDGGSTIRIEQGGDIRLGSNAAELVALANLVKAELDKIQTTLGTGSTPAAGGAGGAVTFGTPYTASDVGASKVRAE